MGFPVRIIENRKSKETSSWLTLTSSPVTVKCCWAFLVSRLQMLIVMHFWVQWLLPGLSPRCPQSAHWTGHSPVSGLRLRLRTGRTVSHCQSRIRRRPAQAHTGPHLPHSRTQDSDKVFSAKIRLYSTDIFLWSKIPPQRSDPSISADRCVLWRWMWLVWKHHIWKVSFYVASFIMIVMLVQTQQE